MPLLTREIKDGSYKPAPSADNYLNTRDIPANRDGKLRITLLGDDVCTGYQIWATGPKSNIAMRFSDQPSDEDIKDRCKELGASDPKKPSFFMAYAVWNYSLERVQVFQFTQTSLINPLVEALSDEEIEMEPWATDFNLSHNGLREKEKRFIVTPVTGKRRNSDNKKVIDKAFAEVVDAGFDIKRLLVGDPFKPA